MQGTQRGWLINGITILWITIMGLSCASAQDSPAVLEIRTAYTALNQSIARCAAESDDFCGYYLNTLDVNAHRGSWPAVGIYQSQEKFWGQLQEGEEANAGQTVLRKIEIRTDRSSRKEIEEFFFDEAGKLLFYFFKLENDGQSVQELRFYFKAGKLIDYKEKIAPEEVEYQRYQKTDFEAVLKDAERLGDAYQASFR